MIPAVLPASMEQLIDQAVEISGIILAIMFVAWLILRPRFSKRPEYPTGRFAAEERASARKAAK